MKNSSLCYRLEPTQSKLSVLFAKQGRAQQFATQAARDEYLRDEIESLQEHEKNQTERVEILQKEVAGAKEQLAELSSKSDQQAQSENDRRENLKKMNEEVAQLQKNIASMHEQKKYVFLP